MTAPYDVVVSGITSPVDAEGAIATLRAAAGAGATWWVEADWSEKRVDALRARIAVGPIR